MCRVNIFFVGDTTQTSSIIPCWVMSGFIFFQPINDELTLWNQVHT